MFVFGWNVMLHTSPVGSIWASFNVKLKFLLKTFPSELGCKDKTKSFTGKTNTVRETRKLGQD